MDKLDLEYIGFQNKDKILYPLKITEELHNLITSGYAYNSIKFTDTVEELNKALTALIGYNIKIVYDSQAVMGTYVIPARSESSSLLGNMKNTVAEYEETIVTTSRSSGYVTKWADLDALLGRSYKVLNDMSLVKGVKIDLQKGTITGLDKDFNQFILCNLHRVVKEYNFTASELLAALLHEVGHMYMYLVSMISAHANSLLLLDTIKSEYLGKSVRDILSIAYKRISGSETDTDKRSTPMLVMDIVTAVVTSKTNLISKESERASDVFAVRFGLGAELVTAIAKLSRADYTKEGLRNSNISFIFTNVMMILSAIILSVLILATNGVVLGLLYSVGLSLMVLSIGGGNHDYTDRYDDWAYDTSRDRLARIRQHMIASLKDSNLKTEDIKAIISQVDSVKEVIDNIPPMRKSVMDKIIEVFSRKKYVNSVDLNYIVDSFMNSELVLARARLSEIK